MKILKNKIAAIAISIFFILSMAGSMVLTPSVKAAVTAIPGISDGTHIPTYLYVQVGPNPIGVGQTVNINAFFGSNIIDTEIPNVRDPQNYNVTITSPSGTTTVLSLSADKTGGGHVDFVPTTVGTYKFQASYGGQAFVRPGWVGLIQDPAISAVVTLTVQQEPVVGRSYPFTPLPTSWWQDPVSAENTQNWYAIKGPMVLQSGYNSTTMCNPYTLPVLSAHVLWTRPWIAGGVAGGISGGGEINGAYWTTRQYEQSFNPIIMDGLMISQYWPQSSSARNGGAGSSDGIFAVDLFTGKTVYWINKTNQIAGSAELLFCGMQPQMQTGNMYGTLPPVFWTTGALPAGDTGGKFIYSTGTQYNMYDALNGQYICSIVNGTSLSALNPDDSGNLIGYYQNATVGKMTLWNDPPFDKLAANGSAISGNPTLKTTVNITTSAPVLCKFNFTKALWNIPMGTQGGLQISLNTVVDFRVGVQFAAPTPTTLDGKPILVAMGTLGGGNLNLCGNQIILNSYMHPAFYWTNGWDILAAFNKDTGSLTWIKNYTYPTYPWLLPWQDTWSHGDSMCVDGKLIMYEMHNWNFQAIDSNTGNVAWSNTLRVPYGDGMPNVYNELAASITSTMNYNGQIYIVGFAGEVWDMDASTGNTVWYTNTTNLMGPSGVETPYNVWPIWTAQTPQVMAPGVLYLAVMHQYNPPMFHGAQLLAVNTTDGSLIWKVLMFPQTGQSIAEGVLLHLNGYDGQVWAFAKGPSAVTVTASPAVTTTNGATMIMGTVMDASAGTTQEAQKFEFPYGVPCVSEASMSAYMEYVYEDQVAPTNTTGVPVTLTETDPNGNTYTIGTTRSDASGTFGFKWTPPIEGNYTIVATFDGSNSYYGQCAETYVYAGAPGATPAPTASPASGLATTATVEMIGVAIIIVIIIIGAVLAVLMMRKRP